MILVVSTERLRDERGAHLPGARRGLGRRIALKRRLDQSRHQLSLEPLSEPVFVVWRRGMPLAGRNARSTVTAHILEVPGLCIGSKQGEQNSGLWLLSLIDVVRGLDHLVFSIKQEAEETR